MRTTPVSLCLVFLLAASRFESAATGAEADVRVLDADESPANWTAPPFWVPPGETRGADAAAPAAASRTALTSNPPALPFFSIAPCRLADTRGAGGGPIPPSTIRSFQITGPACNIPAAAQAVSFNLTVTDTQGPGFLLAWPQGGAVPTASVLNFLAGQTIANGAVVALGAGGGMSTALGVSGANLIIDVNGYYAPTGIVASVNNLTGDVALAAGSNVTITPSGTTLTIAAPLTGLNASNVTSGVLGISFGGTGATTVSGARTALGAAGSGANTDITSLSNLTTPLSLTQGGTGSTTAVNARAALGAAARGANADITSLSTLTTPLSIAQGGTGSATAVNARTALGAASRGANADITSLSTLTTPLSIAQGGTGSATPFAGAFQARVTGTCAAGSFVTSIAADGSAVCASPTVDPRPGYSLAAVVSSSTVVGQVAMTVGIDGRGLIVYCDYPTPALKVAHCVDLGCTSVTTSVVETAVANPIPSVAIGTDGLPLISYSTGNKIKTAHCNDVACASATTATLATLGTGGGGWPSIAIGTDGLGVIDYMDGSNLMITRCTNSACSAALPPSLIDAASPFGGTSITIGTDGSPLVSYSDVSTYNLKVARCLDSTCVTSAVASAPGAAFAAGASITVGSDGRGLVSYFDQTTKTLKVAHCDNAFCSSLTVSTLSNVGFNGSGTSITVGPDGLGLIVHVSAFTGVAHCQDAACSTASSSILENANSYPPAITIGADGMALIALADQNTSRLKAIHCGNVFCLPNFRRR